MKELLLEIRDYLWRKSFDANYYDTIEIESFLKRIDGELENVDSKKQKDEETT